MITTGTSLGGFVLGHKIGAGAMGTVYRAHQRSLGRDVVIKTLHPHLAEDESLITRFEREARHAAKLAHPNTVQIIDFGFDRGIHFIAMELVQGIDLKMLLRGAETPPIREGSLMVLHLLRGLEAAHRHGVMHRDIKPANLMLTSEGSVKVMDFGLARQTSEGSTITVAGAVMGSAAYMSPEQAQGHSLDNRTDIFSAGLVAYEVLSGVRAFPGDSYAVVMHSIIYDQPKPLSEVRTGIPAEIVDLVSWMIEKDLDLRCQDISEARARLERGLDREDLATAESVLKQYYSQLDELHPPPLPPVDLPPQEATELASRVAATHPAETRTALAGSEEVAREAATLAGGQTEDGRDVSTVVDRAGGDAMGAGGSGSSGSSGSAGSIGSAGSDAPTAPATRPGVRRAAYLRWLPLAMLPVVIIVGWLAFGGNSGTDEPANLGASTDSTGASLGNQQDDPGKSDQTPPEDSREDGTAGLDDSAQDEALPDDQQNDDPLHSGSTDDANRNGDRNGDGNEGAGTASDVGDGITRTETRPDHTTEDRVFRQAYRISTRPWATVYVDNDPRPYNEGGWFETHLVEGLHLFRIVNEQGRIDTTMAYEVEPGDHNNSLVFDVTEGTVKASRR